MSKRKASLGLTTIIEDNIEPSQEMGPVTETTLKENVRSKPNVKKKQSIPIYVDPLLHDALHVLVFSERHKKASFQSLFIEALDLLFKQRGLPSVDEITRGEKVINL
jgi:hypothetical protein